MFKVDCNSRYQLTMNIYFSVCMLLFLVVTVIAEKPARSFYVSPAGSDRNTGYSAQSPLKSLEFAINKTTQKYGKGPLSQPVTIYLLDGMHQIESPIKINSETAFPIVFKAYNAQKPVISSGVKIDSWQKGVVPWTGRECLIADIEDVKNGKWYFRQLFVNGKRASRPRLPEKGYYQVKELLRKEDGPIMSAAYKDRFVFKEGDIKKWHAFTDINAMLMHYWQENFLMFKEASFEDNIIYFENKTYMPMVHSHPAHGIADWIKYDKQKGCFVNSNFMPDVHSVAAHGLPEWMDLKGTFDRRNNSGNQLYFGAFYYVDNVAEALMYPGQWYLDRKSGRLYYIPQEGQTADNIEVFAPRLLQQFIIEADWRNGEFIEDIKFDGIIFKHTRYDWDKHYGTGNQPANSGPGLIYASGTKGLTVTNCTFENIGEYALDFRLGNNYQKIIGNTFRDLGNGAVKSLGAWREKNAEHNKNGQQHHFYMTDNEINGYGRVFHGSNAINVQMGEQSVVAHNYIHDGYFTTIALGGGSTGHEDVFQMFDTLVYKNRIENIGQGMPCGNDLGGIYMHGNAIGCIVKGNYISNIKCTVYGGNGIYVDDCASYLTLTENLVLGGMQCLNMKGRKATVKNNIFGFSDNIIRRASGYAYETEIADIHENIFLVDKGSVFCLTFNFPGKITEPGFTINNNIIWNIAGSGLTMSKQGAYGNQDSFVDYVKWCKESGQGKGDVLTDMVFTDFEKDNYRITKESPAAGYGFPEVDFSDTGVRPAGQRKNIAFLKSSRNGPEHKESIEYANEILQKHQNKIDLSTHSE